MRPARCTPILAVAAAVLFAAPALAQQTDAKPALRGPDVKERGVPGMGGDFGMGDRRRMERIPPEVYREALSGLRGEGVPEGVRLSAEQDERIKQIVSEFEAEVRAYRQANAKELAELRQAAGDPGRRAQGDGVSMSDGAANAARDGSRRRMREIQESAPKPEALYALVWEELSAAQRAAVTERVEAYREEQAAKREDAMVRQRMQQQDGAAAVARPAEAPAARLRVQAAERKERLLRVFEQLPPEQQEQILARLEGLLKERANAPADLGNQRRRPAKPAPEMDAVRIPNPDGDR